MIINPKNRRPFRLTISFLLLALVVWPAWTEARELLISKGDTPYPPYQYEEDGEMRGICPEIINQAAELLGMTVRYRRAPWERMLQDAQEGEVDGVMPLFKTPERQNFLAFPDQPLVQEENAFFAFKGTVSGYTGKILDLRPYRLGVVRGYSYGGQFDSHPGLHKTEAKNDPTFMRMFSEKRFQVGVGSIYVVSHYARQLGILDDIVFLTPNPFLPEPLFVGFAKNRDGAELAAAFSRAIATLKKNGDHSRILQKYGIAPENAKEVRIIFKAYTPPYAFASGQGLVVDLVKEIMASQGFRVTALFLPIERAFQMFSHGKVDGISIIRQNAGLQGAFYTEPFIEYQNAAMLLKERQTDIRLKTMEDLARLDLIGFQYANRYLGDSFRRQVENNPTYREMANQETQTLMLLKGRTQAVVMDKNIFNFYHYKLTKEERVESGIEVEYVDLFPRSPYRTAFASQELQDAFNRGLETVRRNGRYQTIFSHYTTNSF